MTVLSAEAAMPFLGDLSRSNFSGEVLGQYETKKHDENGRLPCTSLYSVSVFFLVLDLIQSYWIAVWLTIRMTARTYLFQPCNMLGWRLRIRSHCPSRMPTRSINEPSRDKTCNCCWDWGLGGRKLHVQVVKTKVEMERWANLAIFIGNMSQPYYIVHVHILLISSKCFGFMLHFATGHRKLSRKCSCAKAIDLWSNHTPGP